MNDFFADLEAQLDAAARSRVAGRNPNRKPRLRSLRTGVGAVAMTAAAAVVVVVVVVALTLGHGHAGGSPPGASGARQQQELNYIRTASQKALRSAACRETRTGAPTLNYGSPSPALLSILAVLRRPATGADTVRRSFLRNLDANGIYVHYIRLARVANGASYYIVPAATLLPNLTLGARCDSAIAAALRAELPRIPPALRSPTLAAASRLAARRRQLAAHLAGGGICLLTYQVKGNANGGSCGATVSELKQQGFGGVVPDGVATVTIRYPATNALAARTVTANVIANMFAIPPQPRDRRGLLPTITWRSAHGKILQTIPPAVRDRRPSSGVCSAEPGSNDC
jgi:hypothetical protein